MSLRVKGHCWIFETTFTRHTIITPFLNLDPNLTLAEVQWEKYMLVLRGQQGAQVGPLRRNYEGMFTRCTPNTNTKGC